MLHRALYYLHRCNTFDGSIRSMHHTLNLFPCLGSDDLSFAKYAIAKLVELLQSRSMKKRRGTEEQSIGILKQTEASMKLVEVCRQSGISDATFYK